MGLFLYINSCGMIWLDKVGADIIRQIKQSNYKEVKICLFLTE
jgi:hypothetical protein